MQYANLFQRAALLAASALTQDKTNGVSPLGTADAPTYPVALHDASFVRDGKVLTAENNNPYTQPLPETGNTSTYTFVIERKILAPDGQQKPMLVINGAFPGPTIEANYGDTIIVNVQNRITEPAEGTSLHWHGLLQNSTQVYDGIPSVGQCPVAPGADFTYIFKASLYGTSWYHSHYSAQYADGLFGAMIIHGPNLTEEAGYDTDLGPVILSDWYHQNYTYTVEQQESNNPVPPGIPEPDNNLINGKMFFECPPETKEEFEIIQPDYLTCYQDNQLRALEHAATQASTFCPTFLATTGPTPLPTYVSQFQSTDVSSACSCFEASATVSAEVLTLTATAAATPTVTPGPKLTCTPNAPISTFNFQSGKRYRLRLINAGAEALQRFSIDGHEMLVIANDFVPVNPYNATVVTLGVGQRTDVIVTANGSPTDSVYMRSMISQRCVGAPNPLALATIFYENADQTMTPPDNPQSINDTKCGNDDLQITTPLYDFGQPLQPSVTQIIDIEFHNNGTDPPAPGEAYGKNGSLQWFMNNSTFHANYDHPILNLTYNGNTSYPSDPQWNVYNFGSNTTVRMILRNHVSNFHASHPMHLHGHNFLVLAEGYGDYDGHITNSNNPQRRDTHVLQQALNGTIADPLATTPSYVVLQWEQDNPGIWPLHCHRAWHVSSGLYINIMERPDDITESNIPGVMEQTCKPWYAYDSKNVVDEIDSGV